MLGQLFLSSSAPSYSDEILDILRLIRSENVGPRTFLNLIKLFGSAKNALENIAEFSIKGGRSKPIKVFSLKDAEKELELLSKNKAQIITYQDPAYSKLLLQIPDLPPVLSFKGRIELFDSPSVAIVGARNASMNGRAFAAKIASELVKHGYVIVSGLARGIDTAAHQASINSTIAVIAGGIDHIYPPENKKLYEQIAENGLIIAELPVGSVPLGQHFPQRNRLISGCSLGTIVIEASLKSGSLITAKLALEQNREVFAVPGFPLDPRCQGTNKLIKEGANLLENSQDVLDNLPNIEEMKKELADSAKEHDNFTSLLPGNNKLIDQSTRERVITLLSSTPIDIDTLQQETGLSLPVIYIVILELELAGRISRYPGNKISLIYE